MYYPEFCNVKFRENWFGKIIEVKYNNVLIEKEEFMLFYNKI